MKSFPTTAVIDKSLFQAICCEPEAIRSALWNEIFKRYQVVIPFVLIEEVWVNFGDPNEKKRPVINEMVKMLRQMTTCWMDDEIEIVFRELVKGIRIKKLPPPPKDLIDFALSLRPDDPKFLQWLENLRRAKKQAIEDRVVAQRDILSEGSFATISSEGELFGRFARGKFMEILESPQRTKELLKNTFGHQFQNRHPNFKRRIEKAFERFDKSTFVQYPVTLSYIMASMFYFYAPLCRVRDESETTARKIIGSKRSEQRNNISDQQYVVSALVCERLLTCDEGMSNIMKVFKEGGLWKGFTVFLDPNQSIESQRARLLL